MRKNFIKAMNMIVIMLCALMLASCMIIDELGFSKATISVHDGDDIQEYEIVISSDKNKIDPPIKEGYFLKGIYDQTEGGSRFFNGIGRTIIEWKRNDSETLYTQWGTLDEVEFISRTFSNGQSGGYVYYDIGYINDFLLAAALSNPNRKMNVEIHYSIKATNYFSDSTLVESYVLGEDKEQLGLTSFSVSKDWEEKVTTLNVFSHGIIDGKIRLYFRAKGSGISAPNVYVDELYVKITY